MIRVKPGVEFATIAPAGYLILDGIKRASIELGLDLTITSGTDGSHSGPADPHHTGEAYDIRTHDLLPEQRVPVLRAIMGRLGYTRFYGFLEDSGTSNEHLHIQRARHTTFPVTDYLQFPPLD